MSSSEKTGYSWLALLIFDPNKLAVARYKPVGRPSGVPGQLYVRRLMCDIHPTPIVRCQHTVCKLSISRSLF